jgi:hypothetical protein
MSELDQYGDNFEIDLTQYSIKLREEYQWWSDTFKGNLPQQYAELEVVHRYRLGRELSFLELSRYSAQGTFSGVPHLLDPFLLENNLNLLKQNINCLRRREAILEHMIGILSPEDLLDIDELTETTGIAFLRENEIRRYAFFAFMEDARDKYGYTEYEMMWLNMESLWRMVDWRNICYYEFYSHTPERYMWITVDHGFMDIQTEER